MWLTCVSRSLEMSNSLVKRLTRQVRWAHLSIEVTVTARKASWNKAGIEPVSLVKWATPLSSTHVSSDSLVWVACVSRCQVSTSLVKCSIVKWLPCDSLMKWATNLTEKWATHLRLTCQVSDSLVKRLTYQVRWAHLISEPREVGSQWGESLTSWPKWATHLTVISVRWVDQVRWAVISLHEAHLSSELTSLDRLTSLWSHFTKWPHEKLLGIRRVSNPSTSIDPKSSDSLVWAALHKWVAWQGSRSCCEVTHLSSERLPCQATHFSSEVTSLVKWGHSEVSRSLHDRLPYQVYRPRSFLKTDLRPLCPSFV